MRYKKTNTQFTVKLCTECNHAWEKDGKNTIMHLDFPTYGLQRRTCCFCVKKSINKAVDSFEIAVSNCCGAMRWNDFDLCSECLEHADFGDNTDELESIKIDNKQDTL